MWRLIEIWAAVPTFFLLVLFMIKKYRNILLSVKQHNKTQLITESTVRSTKNNDINDKNLSEVNNNSITRDIEINTITLDNTKIESSIVFDQVFSADNASEYGKIQNNGKEDSDKQKYQQLSKPDHATKRKIRLSWSKPSHHPKHMIPLGRRPPRRFSYKEKDLTTLRTTSNSRIGLELICYKKGMAWLIELEEISLPEVNPILSIEQDGFSLEHDEDHEACWMLRSPQGTLTIITKNDVISIKLDENFYLFKLGEEYRQTGRYVRTVTKGWYLVVVPQNWRPDENLCVPISFVPEVSSLRGYLAYLYRVIGGERISFHTEDGQTVLIATAHEAKFFLEGKWVPEDVSPLGRFFIGEPPRIRGSSPQVWADVKTIVFGEEGRGKALWSRTFHPARNSIEQVFPHDLAAKGTGWFFVRFYDINDFLIDSLDFRYSSAIEDIKVYPGSSCIEFIHKDDCQITPIVEKSNQSIKIDRQATKTVIRVPPEPTFNETSWLMQQLNGNSIEMTLSFERFWWAVSSEDIIPDHWFKNPIKLSRSSFVPTAGKIIWLLVPKKRREDKTPVLVGFTKNKRHVYSIKHNEKTVAIPLHDYYDAEELRTSGEKTLYLWTHPNAFPIVLCKIEVKTLCKICQARIDDVADLRLHIERYHLDTLFVPLTYNELRKKYPDIPIKIYCCIYCSTYIPSNDPVNPTSAICNHIEKYHFDKPHDFRVITNIKDIIEALGCGIPPYCKCTHCGKIFCRDDSYSQLDHLFERHQLDVLTLG